MAPAIFDFTGSNAGSRRASALASRISCFCPCSASSAIFLIPASSSTGSRCRYSAPLLIAWYSMPSFATSSFITAWLYWHRRSLMSVLRRARAEVHSRRKRSPHA